MAKKSKKKSALGRERSRCKGPEVGEKGSLRSRADTASVAGERQRHGAEAALQSTRGLRQRFLTLS